MAVRVKANTTIGRGTDKAKRRVSLKRSQWEALVAEADNSGESARAFCLRRGITQHSFYKWRLRFQKEALAVKKAPRNSNGSSAFAVIKTRNNDKMASPKVASIFLPKKEAAAPTKIISPFILRGTKGLRLEFTSGCTTSELKLVAEVLSC
jgi:transposase-like protein